MIEITFTEQISVITFGNIPYDNESGFISAIFRAAADKKINIDMISKAAVSTDRTTVGFTFSDNDMPQMLEVLGKVSFYRPPLVSCGNVKVVVKSAEMAVNTGFAMKIFDCLNHIGVTPILVTTSVDEVSVIVRESDYADFDAELRNCFSQIN